MVNEASRQPTSTAGWQIQQVYLMATICLVVGIAVGYLFHGSASPTSSQKKIVAPQPQAANPVPMPSLDEMKRMADVKAAALFEKLKSNPDDADLLVRTGELYKRAHQFKDAAGYYDKALKIDPRNVSVRSEMASCLYYSGDVDGAISQLRQALRYDPKNANSLFNLGMIEWQGKQDTKGALAAWQELLKTNPQLSANRSAQVNRLIAELKTQGKN